MYKILWSVNYSKTYSQKIRGHIRSRTKMRTVSKLDRGGNKITNLSDNWVDLDHPLILVNKEFQSLRKLFEVLSSNPVTML